MESEGVSSDTLSPPLAQKAQTQRPLAMQRDYTGRVDFGIPTDSLRRQIPDLPHFLTLTPYLGEVAWEPGAWGAGLTAPIQPHDFG